MRTTVPPTQRPARRRALAISVAAVLAAVALVPVAQAAAPSPRAAATSPAPVATYNEARPVLAYYYAWWRPSDFANTLYTPTQPYNSSDSGATRRHVAQAQSAGIDGFVQSWRGVGETDDLFGQLLEIGRESGFRATIHVETPFIATGNFAAVGPRRAEDVVAHLQAFYATRLAHPSLVTHAGRPVLFFWRAETFDNATWSAIRAQVDPNRRAVWLADGDKFDILTGDAWDGISPYAIAWSSQPGAHLASWAAKATAADPNKLFVPPVSPGCDDTAARSPTCVQGRADGSYYQSTLDAALALGEASPWAVVVSTFNEWMESTQIEPSAQYGDTYLRLTRDFAGAYKSSTNPLSSGG